jgi:spermidine/putrescine transport system substrate-binding protein
MVNRRIFLMGGAAAAVGCKRERPRLNVFNWSSYVAEDTIPNFEKEFGVEVRYSVYESNEEMLARVTGGNSGWDVVFPSAYYIGPMRDQGLLAPLRHDRLRNLDQIEPMFRKRAWDPGLEWSTPYMWNATGLVHNRSVQPAPMAWSDLWSSRLRGRLTMLDDPVEVIGAALKKLGFSWNATDPEQLKKAQREAIAQKPYLRAYINAEVRDQLVAGDVLAAQLWSTSAQQAMDDSKALAFVYPREGYALYLDSAVILKESKRQDLAHQFLDYLLRPKVAAAVATAVRTATANAGARALLPPEVRDNPVLYPEAATLARGEWAETLPPETQQLRDRLWTEIKAA